jgi:hypothetical protein
VTATEAERRRAAGEEPFCDTTTDVKIAMALLGEAATGAWSIRGASVVPYSCAVVSSLVRALVLQTLLVTFSPPWEDEVPT